MATSKPQFDPRRAKPGQAITVVDALGKEHTLRADEDGVMRPSNATEKRAADLYGLPVARSAAPKRKRPAKRKAASKPKSTATVEEPTTSVESGAQNEE